MDTEAIDFLTTPTEIWAGKFAGNHKKRSCFSWHYDAQPEKSYLWGLFPLQNRDSDLRTQSNADVFKKELAEFIEADNPTVEIHSFRHWGNGWTEELAVQVYKDEVHKDFTPAFESFVELLTALYQYVVLDESDYSKRVYEETLKNISLELRSTLGAVEEGLPEKVWNWLWDNNQEALENSNDDAPYPTTEEISEALRVLGKLEEGDDE